MGAASHLIRFDTADGQLPSNWHSWEETNGWQTAGNVDMIAGEIGALVAKLDAACGTWLARG